MGTPLLTHPVLLAAVAQAREAKQEEKGLQEKLALQQKVRAVKEKGSRRDAVGSLAI